MAWKLLKTRWRDVGLGACKITGVEALKGDMTWNSFSERIDNSKVLYRTRMKFKNYNNWIRTNMELEEWKRTNYKNS